jgi:hypothetical protein
MKTQLLIAIPFLFASVITGCAPGARLDKRTTSIDTARWAYTGLFIKTKGEWKIKHEHESRSCLK